MKKVLLFALAAMTLVACKKDEKDNGGTTTPSKTTEEKILGNWDGDVLSQREVVVDWGIDTTVSQDISYLSFEFKTGNIVTLTDNGSSQTQDLSWSVINDNMMTFDGDTFDIVKLSTTEFDFAISFDVDLGGGVIDNVTQTIELNK